MNKNYYNFSKLEKINFYVIKKFIQNNQNNLFLNFRNYNLEKACYKYLYFAIANSKSYYNLYSDIKNHERKKIYVLENYELKLLAKELLNYFGIKNIILFNENNLYKNIIFIIKYSLIIIFSFFFKLEKNNEKKILCILNHKKFKDKFDFLLSKIKVKKKFINQKKLIYLLIKSKININLRNYFKDILKQKSFIFMHKIYLKTYIYDMHISTEMPHFIIFFEGDATDHEICSEIAKSINIKSICVQWGGVIFNTPKASFQNSGYSKLLVWGNNYKKLFKKYNKDVEIKVIGNPFLKEIKNKERNNILFLLPQRSYLINDDLLKKFLDLIIWSLKFGKNKIFLRTHPQDNSDSYLMKILKINKIRIYDPNKISLSKNLINMKLLVTLSSGALIEAGRLGVIPLMMAPNKNVKYNDAIEKLKKKFSINLLSENLVQLKNTITNIMLSKDNINNIDRKIKSNFLNEINFIDKTALNNFNKSIREFIK
jgi:hypothetical protein